MGGLVVVGTSIRRLLRFSVVAMQPLAERNGYTRVGTRLDAPRLVEQLVVDLHCVCCERSGCQPCINDRRTGARHNCVSCYLISSRNHYEKASQPLVSANTVGWCHAFSKPHTNGDAH